MLNIHFLVRFFSICKVSSKDNKKKIFHSLKLPQISKISMDNVRMSVSFSMSAQDQDVIKSQCKPSYSTGLLYYYIKA